MSPIKLRFAWLFAAFLALPVFSSEAPFSRPTVDLRGELAAAAESGRPFALLIEMDDCPACAELKGKVLADRRAEADFGRRYRSARVSVDSREPVRLPNGERLAAAALAETYRVPGTPALLFFAADGQLLYRHLGPLADARALNLLGRYVAGRHYDALPFAQYAKREGQRR